MLKMFIAWLHTSFDRLHHSRRPEAVRARRLLWLSALYSGAALEQRLSFHAPTDQELPDEDIHKLWKAMDDEAEMRVPLRKFLAFMRRPLFRKEAWLRYARMTAVQPKRKVTKRNLLLRKATATWKKDLALGAQLSEDEAPERRREDIHYTYI